MRQHAMNAGFMTVEEPLSIHRNLTGPHIAFDQSYGRARWGRIMVASDAIRSDNFCILHPCSTSSPSTAEITSDSSIKCYLTTPITEEWVSDVIVTTGEQHLYLTFGGDNQGILINPATSGMFPPRSSSTNSDILIFTSTGWITGRLSDLPGDGRNKVNKTDIYTTTTPGYLADKIATSGPWLTKATVTDASSDVLELRHGLPGADSDSFAPCVFEISLDSWGHVRYITIDLGGTQVGPRAV